jgi:hypothetical protein
MPDPITGTDIKLLERQGGTPSVAAPAGSPASKDLAPVPAAAAAAAAAAALATRQLADLPRDELGHLAEDLGLEPRRYRTNQHLVTAIHERRQMIASLDREAMLDVVRWGRRPVTASASKEQIAQEILRIRSMRFGGLTHRGLFVLARLRNVAVSDEDSVPLLVRKLKKQEGLFSRINRKRRTMLGSMIAHMVGEDSGSSDYRFLPSETADDVAAPAPSSDARAARASTIKEDIEDAGLLGGIANRVKKTADAYLNQKLDEIESRIDRKLDEIDRRLAEWRDKEIANRIRILKITLWASVIVGICSLIYAYITQVLLKGP